MDIFDPIGGVFSLNAGRTANFETKLFSPEKQKTHRPDHLWRWVEELLGWIQTATCLVFPRQKTHTRGTYSDNSFARSFAGEKP